MLTNFLTVAQQVLILFILMSLGAVGGRRGLIGKEAVSGMTNVVLYFVTPCVILNSFQREAEPELFRGLLMTAGLAAAIHLVSILAVRLIIKDKEPDREKIFRFAAVFSNCGFMSLPIQQALLGDIGVFYGAVYVAVFNVFLWTYGLTSMSGSIKNVKAKSLILNPGILGTVLGFLIFALGIKLPVIVAEPISYMAALNTPLPMIIIGYYLGNLKLGDLKSNPKQYISIFVRLIAVPAMAILLMFIVKADPVLFTVCTVACCAPTAAVTAMFATRFGGDAKLAAQMVSVSTLFSVATIPLMTALAQRVAESL